MIPHKLHTAVAKHPRILAALDVCKVLRSAGYQAWWVGGCVRDFLLNPQEAANDIDISTDASFDQVRSLLPKTLGIGKAFGVGLTTTGEFSFEISTFRKESEYTDRRHPSLVSRGTIEEDSARRDFTINALYFDPIDEYILDFHSGVVDLENRELRCVGDAAMRLNEDPLRILRLYRFAANLDFTIETGTKKAAEQLVGELVHISLERVLLEISKLKSNAVGKFTLSTREAQSVLLHHNAAGLLPSSRLSRAASPSQLSQNIPPEACQYPGTVFVLMCISNFADAAIDWLQVFSKWPLSVTERAHLELIIRFKNKKFKVPKVESGEAGTDLWFQFLEQCRWLMRQNRTLVLDAAWLVESLSENNLDSTDLLQRFCRVCSAEHSRLSIAQAMELTITIRANPIRSELTQWSQNQPPEALGWARLMTDTSLLLSTVGFDPVQLPDFLFIDNQHPSQQLCRQAESWASQTRLKKKTPRGN